MSFFVQKNEISTKFATKRKYFLTNMFLFCTKIFPYQKKSSLPKWYTPQFSTASVNWAVRSCRICSCALTAGTRTACSCKVEEGRDRIGWLVNPPNLITPDCDTPRGSASHGLFPGALWLETYNPTTFSGAWILEKTQFWVHLHMSSLVMATAMS